jgi:toxin ParE1/3/4
MRVRYTSEAASELANILSYLEERNPAAATAIAARIEGQIVRLRRFPRLGQPKYKPGVRMCTAGRFPFLIFYTVEEDEVRIVSIRHAARRPWNEEQ